MPPITFGLVERWPTAFHIGLVSLLESGRCLHFAAFQQLAAHFVADRVEWRDHFFGELAGLAQDGFDQLVVDFIADMQGLVMLFDVQQVLHYEFHVTQGGFVSRHGVLSLGI